jgi:hypothetical protein
LAGWDNGNCAGDGSVRYLCSDWVGWSVLRQTRRKGAIFQKVLNPGLVWGRSKH